MKLKIYHPKFLMYYLVGVSLILMPTWDLYRVALLFLVGIFIVITLKYKFNVITLKWWFTLHLFLVSFSEELVFRYLIQDIFFNHHVLLYPMYYNIFLASIFFSIVHVNPKKIDLGYHVLVLIAGLLYGSVYQMIGLEMSIFIHFIANLMFKCAMGFKEGYEGGV